MAQQINFTPDKIDFTPDATASNLPTIGLLEPGNINIDDRPLVDLPEGGKGTVKSTSFEEDGREILIPTIVNGRVLSGEDAWSHYKETGEHLGIFDTPINATAYSKALSNRQDRVYKPDTLKIDFTPEQEKQPGILGKAWDWMTTPLMSKYPELQGASPEERAGLHPTVQRDLTFAEMATTPLGIVGEVAGGAGAIAGLRRFSRLGKLGKATKAPRITPLLEQKVPLGAKPQIFPETGVTLPARDKLRAAIEKSKPLTDEQKRIHAKELRDRLEEMGKVETPGLKGHRERKGQLAGEFEKVEIEPLSKNLSGGDLNELIDEVQGHPQLMPLEKIRAGDAVEKLFNGQVPQPNEIALLRKVFGDEINDQLIEMAGKKVGIGGKIKGVVGGTQDLMRSLLTSFDFSAPGRQGKNFMSYPEYWKAYPQMFKSWGSRRLYDAGQDAIMAHPNFTRPTVAGQLTGKSVAERGGLSTTDLLTNREEVHRSILAEKIPIIGRMVAASNRAYVGFLNKLRADMFNRMVKETGGDILKNDVKLRAIGSLINDLTGRGKLPGSLEKHSEVMNALFFAPRLHAGKIRAWGRVFNPKFYATADPVVRKTALRSLITSTSFGVLVGELFKQAGAEVNNDPTNSDFRKIKIGDTRIDPFGGDQQYAVAAARLLTGKSTSSTSGRETDIYSPGFGEQSAGGVLADFMANRLAPIPSMAVNLLFDKSYGDEEFGIQSELLDKTVPIMVQDIQEIMEQDPDLWPALIPGAFGVGIQTYGR